MFHHTLKQINSVAIYSHYNYSSRQLLQIPVMNYQKGSASRREFNIDEESEENIFFIHDLVQL